MGIANNRDIHGSEQAAETPWQQMNGNRCVTNYFSPAIKAWAASTGGARAGVAGDGVRSHVSGARVGRLAAGPGGNVSVRSPFHPPGCPPAPSPPASQHRDIVLQGTQYPKPGQPRGFSEEITCCPTVLIWTDTQLKPVQPMRL